MVPSDSGNPISQDESNVEPVSTTQVELPEETNEPNLIEPDSTPITEQPCSSPSPSVPLTNELQIKHLDLVQQLKDEDTALAAAASDNKLSDEKRRNEDKVAIYKALAIKLKKELVKCRDELQALKAESEQVIANLKLRLEQTEQTLDSERLAAATTNATLEANVKNLKSRLKDSETDYNNLQQDYENYKTKASQIMQQNNPLQLNSSKTFEEERYKKLRELNDEQKATISELETRIANNSSFILGLEEKNRETRAKLEAASDELESLKAYKIKSENLLQENNNLKITLKQYKSQLLDVGSSTRAKPSNCDENDVPQAIDEKLNASTVEPDSMDLTDRFDSKSDNNRGTNAGRNENPDQLSPSASVKDEFQTNSSSSNASSTSAFVHIKPTAFEIISRSSVLEEAQNQIDNLTKAYLDSESTNSLLSEQVRALKDEIRRIQRGTERLDLAENLEYLKNIVFKFISLDGGQSEQKQRLVPVLSTILKLSPEETAKLNSVAALEKSSMTSNFFKL